MADKEPTNKKRTAWDEFQEAFYRDPEQIRITEFIEERKRQDKAWRENCLYPLFGMVAAVIILLLMLIYWISTHPEQAMSFLMLILSVIGIIGTIIILVHQEDHADEEKQAQPEPVAPVEVIEPEEIEVPSEPVEEPVEEAIARLKAEAHESIKQLREEVYLDRFDSKFDEAAAKQRIVEGTEHIMLNLRNSINEILGRQ